jgi:hypothetical protein
VLVHIGAGRLIAKENNHILNDKMQMNKKGDEQSGMTKVVLALMLALIVIGILVFAVIKVIGYWNS